MQDFLPGQRWISVAESQMGLGTILSVDHRTISVVFLATGETRTYARQTAPLTRVLFSPGDVILDQDGRTLTVESVREENGLFTYSGKDENDNHAEIKEGSLNNFLQLNRPTERLFNGQIDRNQWFELRYQTQLHTERLAHSDLRGLTGGRTSLIPHQLYIAHEVANRYAPRVLLADEVGLGKTIEAGMILHHQLLSERAKRVLIVVPESLVHQWLVEMLRRFNLFFSILDENRCTAIEQSSGQANPFHSEQLVLCNLDFLIQHPDRLEQAVDGEWDMLVVDEAHHLQWSPQQASPGYHIVEKLARKTPGVLLLTATPEQLGKASHFARLRLLDPDRFPDFDAFIEEEKSYEPLVQAIGSLLDGHLPDSASMAALSGALAEGDNQQLLETLAGGTDEGKANARSALIDHLLDRHGTGRILFRNTRAVVKGFPDRRVSRYSLALPDEYANVINAATNGEHPDPQLMLSPELLYSVEHENTGAAHWTKFDPRTDWLIETLAKLKPQKVLVITHSATTALDLVNVLKNRSGIHAAVFHEHMNIVARDRAAAFFADQEDGSQVLICSEIGSEGRNFQFSHQLVLFDLPLNPDLLEQRIGRLDRIGQNQSIHIHVPCLENSAQTFMFDWFHKGLGAFETTCPAGHEVFVQLKDELLAALYHNGADTDALTRKTRHCHETLNEALHRGRDRLLELNSCRPEIAARMQERALLQDRNSPLPDYMDRMFDCFGVDTELHSTACSIVSPGRHMLHPFPGLPEAGFTITYDRDTALANEDVQYLSWDHPMVTAAMDMVRSGELGNTVVNTVEYQGLTAGTLVLESVFILETAAVGELQTSRFLPPVCIRVVMDEHGNEHTTGLDPAYIQNRCGRINTETAVKIVRVKEQELRHLVSLSEEKAQMQAPQILSSAHRRSESTLQTEIDRLKALQQINPSVRDAEISFFEQQLESLSVALDSARLRLDALRVMVTI